MERRDSISPAILPSPLSVLPPQFAARAKRIIYLHMAGAPSQLELFDYKPELTKLDGQDCPASFLAGKRFAFISGVPKLLGAQYPFHQAGKAVNGCRTACRIWKSTLTTFASSSPCAPISSTMRRRSCWCRPAMLASAIRRSVPG